MCRYKTKLPIKFMMTLIIVNVFIVNKLWKSNIYTYMNLTVEFLSIYWRFNLLLTFDNGNDNFYLLDRCITYKS